MSITFTAEYRDGDITGWNITHYLCESGDVVVSGPYRDYGVARAARDMHDESCRDEACCGAGLEDVPSREMAGAPEVNMANDNAMLVMQALGLLTGESPEQDWDDMWGGASECPAEDLLGRALMALAVSPSDEGAPAYDDSRPAGPRWINCGRRPGYLQEKLEDLRGLAEFCRARGRLVTWG